VKVETRHRDCEDCGGTGMAKQVGDYEDFQIKASEILDSQGKILQPYYLSPETAVAELIKKVYEDLMINGKKSVGIDALIDQQESGEAMKKRLGTFEEFMGYVIYLVYKTHLTKFFEIVQKMLEFDPKNWVDFPQIQTPKRIEIKTPEILQDDFDKAKGVHKIQAAIELYKSKYAEDPITLRTMLILTNFYPVSIFDIADQQSLILNGSFSRTEVSKALRALPIIKGIIEGMGVTEKTDQKIYEETELILEGIIQDEISEPPIDEPI